MSCFDLNAAEGSYWEQRRAPIEKLPTLQDLLACCNVDAFVRVVLDEHAARLCTPCGDDSSKRRRKKERRLACTLDSMKRMSIKRKCGRDRVLLPREFFISHEQMGLIERRVGVWLVHRADVPLARAVLEAHPDDPVEQGVSLPEHSLSLAPWEDALSSRVWLGGSWNLYERYLVLSSAFWEMTHFGFDRDCVAAAQARAKTKTPPEDSVVDGCLSVTVSDLRLRRATDFGLIVPDRFDEARRACFATRVARLNRAADLDLCCRIVDLDEGRGS